MKTIKFNIVYVLGILFFIGCGDDDAPDVINQEELITSLTIALEADDQDTVVLSVVDLDGFEGPNDPQINVSGNLEANTTYTAQTISLLNTNENPAENITVEVEEEADEHQFFFVISNSLNASVSYADTENDYTDNGSDLPVGLSFTLETGDASTGTFTVTLRHEPNKEADGVAEGELANAGGETDISVTFPLEIE